MPEPTKLTIVRHGESKWNLARRLQRQLDEDDSLTQTGVAQAQAIAQRLARVSFAALYSSDLTRAYQTAEAIANRTGHTILTDQRLREARHCGESWRQCFDRVVCCLGEIARKHSGESVVVVTHIGPLEALFSHTLDIPVEKGHPFNPPGHASLNIFFYEENHWILETWGDVAHLESMGTLNGAG